MRKVLILSLTCVLIISLQAFSEINHNDPLFKNRIIGNSAEVLLMWPGAQAGDTCSARIYDGSDLNPSNRQVYHGVEPYKNYKMLDVTAGDYDGDGREDAVLAYFDYANNDGWDRWIRLVIPNINGYSMQSANHYYEYDCCASDMDDISMENLKIRLISGNFDDDANDEFVLAFWSTADHKLTLHLYNADDLDNPEMTAELATDYLDEDLKDANKFDLAAGDFNGDGIDEILIAGGYILPDNKFGIYARVVQSDYVGDQLIMKARKDSLYYYSEGSTANSEGDYVERIAVTTGDYNGDRRDEAVIAMQHRNGDWEDFTPYWPYGWDYRTWLSLFLAPISVSIDLNTINFDVDNRVQYSSGEYKHLVNQFEPRVYDITGSAMSVVSGDLNLDGRDELLCGFFNKLYVFSLNNSLELDPLGSYNRSYKWNDISVRTLGVADVNVNPDEEKWTPEVIMFDWSASGKSNLQVLKPQIDQYNNIYGFEKLVNIPDEFPFDLNPVALVTGDFDGDAVKLGSPQYTNTTSYTQPTVIINPPPVHYDIVEETTLDVNGCFEGNFSSCPFMSVYETEASQTSEVLTTVKADWGLSVGFGASYNYMGVTVGGYIGASYGEGFEEFQSEAVSITVGSSDTTRLHDLILATETDYDIWEYPIFWNNISQGSLLVVVPSSVQSKWYSLDSWTSPLYIPRHETGNLLSYSDYDNIPQEDDMVDTLIHENAIGIPITSETGGNWWLKYEDFGNNSVSTTYSFGMAVGASVSGYGMAAEVSGSYSSSQIRTHRTSFSNAVKLSASYGGRDENIEAPYRITPYAFWSKNGALVLDYLVEPITFEDNSGINTIWDDYYRTLPDLAFALPWRYHIEKGFSLTDPTRREQTLDIYIIADTLGPARPATLWCNVRNFSLADCSDEIGVDFYLGDPDQGGEFIGSGVNPLPDYLASREKMEFYYDWTILADIKKYSRIYAVIDGSESVDEIHEDNNKGWFFLTVEGGIVTDIEDGEGNDGVAIPESFVLYNNYPNPFNPNTTISFGLPARSKVSLSIYNILGRKVKTLIAEELPAGYHSVDWDSRNERGQQVSSGMYFYQLTTDDFIESRKMILLK